MVGMKEEIRKGPWAEQEDLQLVYYVGLFGERRWEFIAKVSGLNRTGKSCRLRWVNYLHPGLKRGHMTPQEERLVLELHSRWGNRWSRIARKLPGRTDNEIKNYWRTHMRKKAQEQKRNSSLSSPATSSSSSCLSSQATQLPSGAGLEQKELNSKGHGAAFAELGEYDFEATRDYSMDHIWEEITSSEAMSESRVDQCKEEVCSTYSSISSSPMWEYSSYSLWEIDDNDFKSLNSANVLSSNFQHERESWYYPA